MEEDGSSPVAEARTNEYLRALLAMAVYCLGVISALVPIIGGRNNLASRWSDRKCHIPFLAHSPGSFQQNGRYLHIAADMPYNNEGFHD